MPIRRPTSPRRRQAAAPTLYAPPQLDQMLAPIALYPDPLLTQVLTGATYPDEIDQAAQWAAQIPGLSGPQLASTVEGQDWDPSVKSLTPFPQILGMMDQHIDWTQQIGGAFMAQQPDVMDSIQRLRHEAYSAGALRSSAYESVVVSGNYIEIQPANAQLVYVPTYDPRRVYGNWAYGSYPPDYWGPPPGLPAALRGGAAGLRRRHRRGRRVVALGRLGLGASRRAHRSKPLQHHQCRPWAAGRGRDLAPRCLAPLEFRARRADQAR